MNGVIYARFSPGSNQNYQSIEGQLKVCRDYARVHGITIIKDYIDTAKTGKMIDKREQFQQMILDSAKKQFEVVLVYQFDRFARNRYDSATTKAKLKKNGVKVLSALEQISDDASGILMESVLEGMAEYYSAEMSQKIRRGMGINAEKLLVYGAIPYGYNSVEKHYVINEEAAQYVRKIFKMYLDGKTMVSICDYLNGLGLKTRKGNKFTVTFINKVLQNKRYCGYYTYKGTEVKDGIPAIVSEDVFNEVSERMSKNRKRPAASKAIDEMYLLTGKLYCGHCTGAMTGTSGKSKTCRMHQYYGCFTRIKDKTKCDKKSVQKKFIEDLVVNECHALLSDESISRIADEVMKICEGEKDTSTLARLIKSLKEIEKQKNNLINSLKVGAANESFQKMVFEQFESLEKQEAEVKKDIMLEENLQSTLTREHILFFLTNLRNGDINDYKYRQMLIDVFVNKIYLYDKKLKIVFTTQFEQVEVDVSMFADESSYLDASSPP